MVYLATDSSSTSIDPGTPGWFLKRRVNQLMYAQPRYDELECYVTGDHPFPTGDARYVKGLRSFQKMARTNYYGLVTMSPVERMKALGIKFGDSQDADDEVAAMLLANDWDYQEAMIYLYGATFGDAYVLASPPDEDSDGYPVFTMEDPRMCSVEYDPARPTRAIAGLRMWEDVYSERIVAILDDGQYFHYYEGPKVDDCLNWDRPTLTKKLTKLGDPYGFTKVAEERNPIGVVSMVRYAWNPSLNNVSLGEAESYGLKDIQDRINQQILDKLIISRAQAYKQRWASGIQIPDGRNKQKKPPFDPGSDILWAVTDTNAKFGEFSEADIRQVLESVTQDVGDMAAISKTPPHYLLGKIVNASGDALKASEAGLVSKTRLRMRSMGFGHERLVKIGFKWMDNPKATQSGKTIWADPEERPTSELADAGLKYTQMGIPLALAMEKMQFTPEEIAFAVAEKKKEDARQLALMAAGQLGQAQASQKTQAQFGAQGGRAPAGNGTKANQTNRTDKQGN